MHLCYNTQFPTGTNMQPAAQNETKLAELRKDYALSTLDESQVAAEPFSQIRQWLDEALAAQCPEPSAMSLATVGVNGRPSSRIVLLKEIDDRGLVFAVVGTAGVICAVSRTTQEQLGRNVGR